MTLGCGGYGGNITSDNISPRHLLNIKRLAYEITPAVVRPEARSAASAALPRVAAPPPPSGIAAESLARRIDQFLASRGYTPPGGADRIPAAPAPSAAPAAASGPAAGTTPEAQRAAAAATEKPAEFVCEDDVRQAVRQGRKITIGERSIVTPAARDLGEQHRLFVHAAWPR
jgi:hypothetical protein